MPDFLKIFVDETERKRYNMWHTDKALKERVSLLRPFREPRLV